MRRIKILDNRDLASFADSHNARRLDNQERVAIGSCEGVESCLPIQTYA